MDLPSTLTATLGDARLSDTASTSATDKNSEYILRVQCSDGVLVSYTLMDRNGVEIWHWPPQRTPNTSQTRSIANDNQGHFVDIDA